MQNLKKLLYSALTCTFLLNLNIPANSTQKEVKVYSGRHYNTDRGVYKKFAEETGIKVRLIEAAGISLIERLKREGKNSQADLILIYLQILQKKKLKFTQVDITTQIEVFIKNSQRKLV